jgi:hypothetical protein
MAIVQDAIDQRPPSLPEASRRGDRKRGSWRGRAGLLMLVASLPLLLGWWSVMGWGALTMFRLLTRG